MSARDGEDVLAVLDADFVDASMTRMHDADAEEKAARSEQARAAIAELIAADREYDEARTAFDALFRPATHTSTGRFPKHSDPAVVRYHHAFARRAAALANVGASA